MSRDRSTTEPTFGAQVQSEPVWSLSQWRVTADTPGSIGANDRLHRRPACRPACPIDSGDRRRTEPAPSVSAVHPEQCDDSPSHSNPLSSTLLSRRPNVCRFDAPVLVARADRPTPPPPPSPDERLTRAPPPPVLLGVCPPDPAQNGIIDRILTRTSASPRRNPPAERSISLRSFQPIVGLVSVSARLLGLAPCLRPPASRLSHYHDLTDRLPTGEREC